MKGYLVCIVIVGLIVAFAYWAETSRCDDVAQQTGLEVKFSFTSGCYIKTTDGWWPVP